MANGAAVKVPEELRNFNRVVPPGAGVPGTEWFSQVELGVFITFVTLSNGCNALKRIRFRYYLEKSLLYGSRINISNRSSLLSELRTVSEDTSKLGH